MPKKLGNQILSLLGWPIGEEEEGCSRCGCAPEPEIRGDAADGPEAADPTKPPDLEKLLDHLEWANRRALGAVAEAGDDGARRRLAHLLAAETVWLRRLETGDSSGIEIWPDLSMGECEERFAENAAGYRRYLADLGDGERDAAVAYRNSKGEAFRTPAVDILLHVFLHGSYHRGQIAMRIRDAGGDPVNTDYIAYVRSA